MAARFFGGWEFSEQHTLSRLPAQAGYAKGKTHEKVYDVVCSGDRTPAADGELPAVGNTVDVKNATWSNAVGSNELIAVWTDPDFDSK